MPDVPLSWPLLAGLLVLGGLLGGSLAAAVSLRSLARRERRMERRMVELRRRIAQLECRLDPSTVAAPAPARPDAAVKEPAAPIRTVRSTLIEIPDLAREAAPGDPQAGDELGQKHREVWALADAGTSPEEIARHTGQPIGEVELIVGLRRRLNPSRGATEHVRSQ